MSDEQTPAVDESIESELESSEESSNEQFESDEGSEVQAQTEQELKDEIKEAVKNGASEKQVNQMVKEYHLKVNGKDYIRKLDLSDEEGIKRELQKALAGQMAMQESATLKKSVDNLIQQLKNDPFGIISELGLNPEELSKSYLEKIVQDRQKSPEEREKEELQKKLQEYESRIREEEQRRVELEQAQIFNEARMNLEQELIQALEKNPDLPNTPKVHREIGAVMAMFTKKGMNVTVEDVIPTVKYRLQQEVNELINAFGDKTELFEAFIGKQNLDKYRNKKLESMKNRPAPIEKKVTQTAKNTQESKPGKKMSLEQWLRTM